MSKKRDNGSGIAENPSVTPIGQPMQSTPINFQTMKKTMLCSPLEPVNGRLSVPEVHSGEGRDKQSSKKTD